MNMNTQSNQKMQQNAQNFHNKIICNVTNCAYHEPNDSCSAKEVKVGPQFASSSEDTLCSTFRP